MSDVEDEVGGEWVEETTVRFTDADVLTVEPTVEPEDRLLGVRSMTVFLL